MGYYFNFVSYRKFTLKSKECQRANKLLLTDCSLKFLSSWLPVSHQLLPLFLYASITCHEKRESDYLSHEVHFLVSTTLVFFLYNLEVWSSLPFSPKSKRQKRTTQKIISREKTLKSPISTVGGWGEDF